MRLSDIGNGNGRDSGMAKLVLRLASLPPPAAFPAEPPAPAPAPHVLDLADHARPGPATPLARWSAAVAASSDPCVVVDALGHILSLSASAAELLGCPGGGAVGRSLLEVVELVDFETGDLRPDYAWRVAPLSVLATGAGLMRSLLRVRHHDGTRLTVDASSAPLHDARGEVVGSLTFLAAVRG